MWERGDIEERGGMEGGIEEAGMEGGGKGGGDTTTESARV